MWRAGGGRHFSERISLFATESRYLRIQTSFFIAIMKMVKYVSIETGVAWQLSTRSLFYRCICYCLNAWTSSPQDILRTEEIWPIFVNSIPRQDWRKRSPEGAQIAKYIQIWIINVRYVSSG
ncbi:hypothetical protein SeMB42_g02070 [Synchytrium endobioticum]|uniref:Uncharacterized protein n=1 Tax=Synchytrium endobioticum TaxID=286115 RepID=A0A507DJ63_9FUNG|nr:hypothetical protein SeMB42_g02070 [Synchytrium endobioticum]